MLLFSVLKALGSMLIQHLCQHKYCLVLRNTNVCGHEMLCVRNFSCWKGWVCLVDGTRKEGAAVKFRLWINFSYYHNQPNKNGIGLSWFGLGRGEENELEMGWGGKEKGRWLLKKGCGKGLGMERLLRGGWPKSGRQPTGRGWRITGRVKSWG